ncbi:hypothetical protein SAMN03097699_0548 [Flavobacteriaceae bacterium MAR_2010_188]|nr:hypothetical protein SAMN03097699_0548 [Flavobacteriaceae bacterium MAR_2010_188]
MKQFFHKSLSLVMAVLVLSTTLSFAIDMHFCGETLVDYSFLKQAKTCGMEQPLNTVKCENPSVSQKSCCSNSQLIKQASDDLKVSSQQLSPEIQIFITSFFYAYQNLFQTDTTNKISFNEYPPPLIQRNIMILHQTFLI